MPNDKPLATDKPLDVRLLECFDGDASVTTRQLAQGLRTSEEQALAWVRAAQMLGCVNRVGGVGWRVLKRGKQRLAEREAWEREQECERECDADAAGYIDAVIQLAGLLPSNPDQTPEELLRKAAAEIVGLREQLPLAERVRAEAERSGGGFTSIIGKWPGNETDEEVQAALPSDEGACHWCGREVVLGGPREADNAGSCFTNVDGETRFACTEHYPVMAAWVDEQVEREQKWQPTPL